MKIVKVGKDLEKSFWNRLDSKWNTFETLVRDAKVEQENAVLTEKRIAQLADEMRDLEASVRAAYKFDLDPVSRPLETKSVGGEKVKAVTAGAEVNDINFQLMKVYSQLKAIERLLDYDEESETTKPIVKALPQLVFSGEVAQTGLLKQLTILLEADGVGVIRSKRPENSTDITIDVLEIVCRELESCESQRELFEQFVVNVTQVPQKLSLSFILLEDGSEHNIVFMPVSESANVLVVHRRMTLADTWPKATREFLQDHQVQISAILNALESENTDLQLWMKEWLVPEFSQASAAEREVMDQVADLFEEVLLKRTHKGRLEDVWDTKGRQVFQERMYQFIHRGEPLLLVLPAFPSKSGNTAAKVLSPWPDMGEKLALVRLERFLKRIRDIHPPGGHLVIFGDGRVYSDCFATPDETVDDFKSVLYRLHPSEVIHWADLDMFFPTLEHADKRRALVDIFGNSLEKVKQRIFGNQDFREVYCGFRKFMDEELSLPKWWSRAETRRRLTDVARAMVQRTDANAKFLRLMFPHHIRLSIHPSENVTKFSVNLVGATDWRTPWHNCVLKREDEWCLIRRNAAEEARHVLALSHERLPFYEERLASSAEKHELLS